MLTLTLTRHGQTVENVEGILQGQTAGHLTAAGIAQTKMLRSQLKAADYDLVLCSDLERTRVCAEIINKKMKLPLVTTPLLRERDWGEYTGRKIRSITTPPSQFPPSIENAEQLAARAHQFVVYLFDHYDGQRLLCMGHGYFNRCIQALIEQKTVHDTPRWENVELRTFTIDRDILSHQGPTDYIVRES